MVQRAGTRVASRFADRTFRVRQVRWQTGMEITVVHAHPAPTSFNRALFDTTCAALAHHDLHRVDLYADGFDPAMTADEHRIYLSENPIVDPMARRYADAVLSSQALVFVYPTWWAGLPAIMKGWMERVLVRGVAFDFDDKNRLRPRLQHIQRLAGVTTYGSNRLAVALTGDGGRRTLGRTLRTSTGVKTRTTWLGLYGIDAASDSDRAAFLERVHREFSTW